MSAGSSDALYMTLNSHSIRHGLAAIGGCGGAFLRCGPRQCTQNRSWRFGSTGRSFSRAAATTPARPAELRWESAAETLCDAACGLDDAADPTDPAPLDEDAGPPRVAVPPEPTVRVAAPPVIVEVFVLFEAGGCEPLRAPGGEGNGERGPVVRVESSGTRGEKRGCMRFRSATARRAEVAGRGVDRPRRKP